VAQRFAIAIALPYRARVLLMIRYSLRPAIVHRRQRESFHDDSRQHGITIQRLAVCFQ